MFLSNNYDTNEYTYNYLSYIVRGGGGGGGEKGIKIDPYKTIHIAHRNDFRNKKMKYYNKSM